MQKKEMGRIKNVVTYVHAQCIKHERLREVDKDEMWLSACLYIQNCPQSAPRSLVMAYGDAMRRLGEVQSIFHGIIDAIHYIKEESLAECYMQDLKDFFCGTLHDYAKIKYRERKKSGEFNKKHFTHRECFGAVADVPVRFYGRWWPSCYEAVYDIAAHSSQLFDAVLFGVMSPEELTPHRGGFSSFVRFATAVDAYIFKEHLTDWEHYWHANPKNEIHKTNLDEIEKMDRDAIDKIVKMKGDEILKMEVDEIDEMGKTKFDEILKTNLDEILKTNLDEIEKTNLDAILKMGKIKLDKIDKMKLRRAYDHIKLNRKMFFRLKTVQEDIFEKWKKETYDELAFRENCLREAAEELAQVQAGLTTQFFKAWKTLDWTGHEMLSDRPLTQKEKKRLKLGGRPPIYKALLPEYLADLGDKWNNPGEYYDHLKEHAPEKLCQNGRMIKRDSFIKGMKRACPVHKPTPETKPEDKTSE